MLGLGTAGRTAAGAAIQSELVDLVAVCDVDSATAETIGARLSVRKYTDLRELAADDNVEAVYLSTPTFLHLPHALELASAGKHLLIEKPVVRDAAEGEALVSLVQATGVLALAVNTRGRDAPVRAMARVVKSGAIGSVLSLTNVAYTNWVLRPRFAYELYPALGGGVTFRQAPHQVEIARTVIQSAPVAVTALAGESPAPVRTVGNYSALVEFANGAAATLVYNGYGYFDTAEITFGIGEGGRPFDPDATMRMREAKAWDLDKYGESGISLRRGERPTAPRTAPGWSFVGLTIVSGERGDLRQSPEGLLIYDERGMHAEHCLDEPGGLAVDFDECYRALRQGIAPEHDAAWGAETVRVCQAISISHRERRRVTLG